MADREQQGVFPYPPPATLRCVTRWDLSWLQMTHLFTGGLFGVFFFFLTTSEMSLLPVLWLVLLTSFSRSSASVSLLYPLLSHTPEFPALFLIHRQHPTPFPWLLPLFPSLCLSGKLCLPCQSPCRFVLCGFCADSGVGFEGKA